MKSKELKNNITYARNNCRLCLSKEIEMAVNMGKSPISEKYVNVVIPKRVPKTPPMTIIRPIL